MSVGLATPSLRSHTRVGKIRFLVDGHQRGKVRRALADYMLHLPAEMMSRASIGGHMGLRCRKLSTPKCSLTTAAFRAEVGACDTRRTRSIRASRQDLQCSAFFTKPYGYNLAPKQRNLAQPVPDPTCG